MSKTKKSLVLSCLSMLVCVTMLIGATFAWFTDNASTGVNKIQAGTLNIDLLVEENGQYVSVKDSDKAIFDYDKWEPGYTVVQNVKVATTGNLALKYTMTLVPKTVTADAFKLAEVIDVYYAPSEVQVSDRSLTGLTKIGTLKDVFEGKAETVISDTMIPGENEEDFATIALKMQESAGNEYQGLNVGEGFELIVQATQYTYENDSFGNTYDENAKYTVVDSTALADAITSAQAGEVVTLASGSFAMPAGNIGEGVTVAGNGPENTKIIAPATPSGNQTTGLLINQSDVTIKDVNVVDNNDITNDAYCGVIDVREGGTTLDNVQVSAGGNTSAVVVKNGVGADETVTIKDSVLKSGYRTIYIVDGANGTVKIDNTDVSGVYTLNVNSASSQNLVIEVTNSKFHGWTSYGDIKSASFTDTEFSMGSSGYNFMRPYANTTLTRCTFKDDFKLGAGASGKTYIINDCNFDGTAITAENVEALLLDLSGSDGTNLKNCTIIVNGTTVVL